jgi:hypothetical protein
MNTLVVKRSNFAQFDITHLKARKLILTDKKFFGPIDVKIVFVYPSGHTETVHTNGKLFNIISDGDKDCIIYGELIVDPWQCHECGDIHYGTDRHKLTIHSTSGDKSEGWLCSNCTEEYWS